MARRDLLTPTAMHLLSGRRGIVCRGLLTMMGAIALAVPFVLGAEDKPADGLARQLAQLDSDVLATDKDKAKELSQMLAQDVRARRAVANQRDLQAWQAVQTKADWERLRDSRLTALLYSLGAAPRIPKDLKVRVTRTLEGDGYRIENLVFESRPGLVVTANLYQPAKPSSSMPGILICHSHHTPKTHNELQDMGMTWARLGCVVLVMDQLGHGERRQHPFVDARSFAEPFAVSRQDYHFRYNSGNQLHLIGESLIGWMVWDLMRGVDLLLARPGIDKGRILLFGSVAGGGDPSAVAAALDRRIAMVAPFNFGGAQREAAGSFNYVGGGSWESTRNLRLSARDGFLPWAIVGSVAPRRLIYAHEFAWDRDNDPVWTRLQKIYDLHGVRDHLAGTTGRGAVTGKPPEATHCTHIGPVHRQAMYPFLKDWFEIATPAKEYQQRRPAEELLCLTPEVVKELKPRPLHEMVGEMGAARVAAARLFVQPQADARLQQLRGAWAIRLGDVEVPAGGKATISGKQTIGTVTVERLALEVEPRIVVPFVLLTPTARSGGRLPVVVGLAQHGKKAFLAQRAEDIAALLAGGVAVCLPDLRGTGETRPADDSRGRMSASTGLSSNYLMLGETLLGSRLRDLRSLLRCLQSRPELDSGRIALWGDSFAPVNPPDRNVQVPWDAKNLPNQCEPLGGLLALFGALFEADVKAIYVRGSLSGYQSALQSPFVFVPHDALVPGALIAGDLCDVAAALAPRPLRLEGLVDGLNRRVGAAGLVTALEPTRTAYRAAGVADRLMIEAEPAGSGATARWLLMQMGR